LPNPAMGIFHRNSELNDGPIKHWTFAYIGSDMDPHPGNKFSF
jgi:hypothetical protein